MLVYRGIPQQIGYGLGSIFASIFRRAVPIVKRGMTYLGRKAVEGAVSTARDVLTGENLRSAARRNFHKSGNDILDTGYKYAKSRMTGRGMKRKRKCQKSANRNKKRKLGKKRIRRKKRRRTSGGLKKKK